MAAHETDNNDRFSRIYGGGGGTLRMNHGHLYPNKISMCPASPTNQVLLRWHRAGLLYRLLWLVLRLWLRLKLLLLLLVLLLGLWLHLGRCRWKANGCQQWHGSIVILVAEFRLVGLRIDGHLSPNRVALKSERTRKMAEQWAARTHNTHRSVSSEDFDL